MKYRERATFTKLSKVVSVYSPLNVGMLNIGHSGEWYATRAD